jgi:hypothetical protein
MGTLAAVTLAGGIAATTASADARPWHHHGGRWVGPAVVGGLAAGLLAAPYYNGYYGYYGRRCWTERQEVIDRWGRAFIRPVRVCG